MLKKFAVLLNSALLSMALSACGSASIGIDLPGGGNPPESAPAQIDANTLILIVLVGVIVIVLAIVFTRKR